MDLLPIKRALISVTDKTGLEELSQTLARGNVEIVSTGGTKKRISASGIPVTAVSEVTGFPEILGGRVKTLHPRIHAGVLADKDQSSHMQVLEELSIKAFDLICVNLYDFARALEEKKNPRDLVEEIDIGGPTLLRAGAKNYHSLVVLPGPEFYPDFERECLTNDFRISLDFRRDMAVKTFALISEYDRLIAKGLAK
ncbi:MAG: IMP cyclohydrolase [Desulfohalobiaceae bacterium]|nr:IMP cyclohydrolase [Desulfohalobiaceae bacterium]